MNFETFLNSLIVAFIRHDFMQPEINAAGIKWEALPTDLVGVPTILSYLRKRKTMSHERAAFDLDAELSILERFSDGLTAIPKDPQVLSEKFQDLLNQYRIAKLGEQLTSTPERGNELLRDFQLKAGEAVKFQSLSELSILVGIQHAQAKEKKSVVKIEGYSKLADMIGGFNPERLGIFLGSTGFGKTNFAVNLTLAAAKSMGVAYVNMEMGYADMVKRFAVIGSKTSYLDYATGNFNPEQVTSALSEHGDKIFLTSGRTLTFDQIAAWARLLAQKNELGLIVIDYDQKVDLNLKYQLEEWKALQKVMEAFEDLSKELQVYVLILAQVNREGLISGSHRAQFPAHTVLAFYEHETLGPIIEAKKNRHGKKSQALKVLYNDKNSTITEGEVITVEKTEAKTERRELKPVQRKLSGAL